MSKVELCMRMMNRFAPQNWSYMFDVLRKTTEMMYYCNEKPFVRSPWLF